jgi:hypothetical protein
VRREWPEETAELVRCEIGWTSGYRTSRFEAVVYEPGERKGRAIGGSEPLRWMFKGVPDRGDRAHIAAVKALRARLIGEGWEDIGDGPAWYARRFVWPGPGPAPTELGGGGDPPAGPEA